MSNKRVSELTPLASVDVAPDDLFLITDISALESKKITAADLETYILSNGSITGTITHAILADTASYIDPNKVGLIPSASYSISSSYSTNGYWAKYSDTASYINAANIDGAVPSSSYSQTASFLLYTGIYNGSASYALTASYVDNAQTASFLNYIPGIPNGTASYALMAESGAFNGSASYLIYNGIPNGTASFALNILNPEITASYLLLKNGRINGSASYAVTSSWASSSYIASQSYYLHYRPGISNGTASYSMNGAYADISGRTYFANLTYSSSFASSSVSSSYALTASYCAGTASYVLTSSYCAGTSSYAIIAGTVIDSNIYRLYGPFNTKDSGGSTTTSEAYIQNFLISPPSTSGNTVIIIAVLDVKVPMTTTDTDLMTVSLYLDYTEPGNTHSYGPIDTSRPNNYISLATSGAFTLSGYNRQSCTLANSWNPVSGSWYRLSVRTTNGALIDTTRGVTFFVYTKPDTTVTKTAYPPF